jgi:hypothetical protein
VISDCKSICSVMYNGRKVFVYVKKATYKQNRHAVDHCEFIPCNVTSEPYLCVCEQASENTEKMKDPFNQQWKRSSSTNKRGNTEAWPLLPLLIYIDEDFIRV